MGYRKDNQYRDYTKKEARGGTRSQDTRSASPSHVTITPKGNEPIERTIKRFLRKVKKSGIIEEYRKNHHYEKPSSVRRREKLRKKATIRKLREKQTS
jgi:small subunit ribosomal protein S21